MLSEAPADERERPRDVLAHQVRRLFEGLRGQQ
jgi:hypothetical protein